MLELRRSMLVCKNLAYERLLSTGVPGSTNVQLCNLFSVLSWFPVYSALIASCLSHSLDSIDGSPVISSSSDNSAPSSPGRAPATHLGFLSVALSRDQPQGQSPKLIFIPSSHPASRQELRA